MTHIPPCQQTIVLNFPQDPHTILEFWSAGFRCWTYDAVSGRHRRVCLPCRLFDAQGQLDKNLLSRLNPDDRLDRQQVLTEYLHDIPKPVRAIAGQCSDMQYLALEVMRHVPGFEKFLRQELQHVGLAPYVFSVWQLARMTQLPHVMRLMVYQRMMSDSRRSVLESLFELPVSKPLLKSLYKLPADDITCDRLWHLYDLSCTLF